MKSRIILGTAIGNTPQPVPTIAGLEPADISNNQADVPLPLLIGQGMRSLQWITPIYNHHAVRVESSSGAAKK